MGAFGVLVDLAKVRSSVLRPFRASPCLAAPFSARLPASDRVRVLRWRYECPGLRSNSSCSALHTTHSVVTGRTRSRS
jgi:hypothetical protein